VWTPTGLQVYVDGLLQGSVTTSKVEGVVDCPYQIGGFNTSGCNGQDPANYSYFPGMIKEVRLWNSTRTPEQIGQTEYTTPLGPRTDWSAIGASTRAGHHRTRRARPWARRYPSQYAVGPQCRQSHFTDGSGL
jgi:hypothetical protein